MAVDDEKGRLCGVRHPFSLTTGEDIPSRSETKATMSSTPPNTASGIDWATQRGMGALAEKMGIEWVEFTVERAVATMPMERSEEHTSELQSTIRTSYAVVCCRTKKTKKPHKLLQCP